MEEVQTYLSQGQLLPYDLAWKEGMTDWIPLEKLFARLSAVPLPVNKPPPSSVKAPSKRKAGLLLVAIVIIVLGVILALRRGVH